MFSYQGFERAELLVWEHDKLNPLTFWTFEVLVLREHILVRVLREHILVLNPLTFWTGSLEFSYYPP